MNCRTFILLLAPAATLTAADFQGSVKWNGLPVPGAVITATEGNRRLMTVTGDTGRYSLETLTPGNWLFEVEMFGFETARREVTVSQSNGTLDWLLQVGAREAARAPADNPKPVSPSPGEQAQSPRRSAQNRAQPNSGAGRDGRRPGTRSRQNGEQQDGGFAQVGVNQTADRELLLALSQPQFDTQQPDTGLSASEAFLVNGSTNRGLEVSAREEAFAFRPDGPFGPGGPGGFGPGGFGRPGGFGPNGMEGPGGADGGAGTPAGDGEARPGGPGGGLGGRPGMDGPGMGGPGMVRGGRGGPGMGGGPGRGGPGMGPGMGGGGGFGGGRGGGFGGRGGPGQRPGGAGVQRTFGNRANRQRDTIRGTASFALRDSAFDARPYSLTGQTVAKPNYSQVRFNGSIGGTLKIPKLIKDDKTFFFLTYSGSRASNPFDAVATVPTAAERSGGLSASPGLGALGIHDPLSSLPFADNRIPASRISTAAAGLLNYFPLPNQSGLVQNYQFVSSANRDTDSVGVRLGRGVSNRDRLAGSFSIRDNSGVNLQPFAFQDLSTGRGINTDLSWIHTFRRGVLNMLRVTFNRNGNDLLPYFAFGPNVAGELGISGTSTNPLNYGPPNLSFTNYGALTDGSPSVRRDQSIGVNNSFTWAKGAHTRMFGGDYRRTQSNSRSDQNGRGTFQFSGLVTSAFDQQRQPLAGSGLDFADFLLGFAQSSSIRYGSSDVYLRGESYSAFYQDDWRLRSNFTLNFGLRYEYQSPLSEKYNRLANLDIAPGFTAVAVVTPDATGPYSGEFPRALVDPDRNNVSPRFAFAWRPDSKKRFQIRGGYGLYYNGSVYNQAAARLAQQPPFAKSTTLVTSLNGPLTLTNGFLGGVQQTITNTFAVARGYKPGYAQSWNLSLQQDLPGSFVLEAGYLGTKGTGLDIQRLPNRAAPGSTLTAEQQRMIGNAVGFTFDSAEGNSIYHAGHLRLTRRFRRGFSMNSLYTFAKSIDNASTLGGGGATVAQNDRDLAAERGLSSFDRRHSLTVFWVYQSPFGDSASIIPMHGFAAKLLRNWSVTGGITAQSGSPFTARVLGNVSNSGGTGSVGSGRANATGLAIDTGSGFFNLPAFAVPAASTFGNAARNTIPGPALLSMNASLGRNFPLGERRGMDFRVETTNLTNRVTFTRLGTTVNASDYGLATGAAGMRTMQLTLRVRF